MGMSILFQCVTNNEEIAAIEQLAARIWEEHYTPIIGAGQVAYMLERFQSVAAMKAQIDQGYRYYALKAEGAIAGYAAVLYQGEHLYVSKFYLARDVRGRGYARIMLSEIEAIACKDRLSRIRLHVNRDNAGSIAIYKKLGFAIVGEEKTDIGGGYVMDDYVMEKGLD